MEPQRSGQSLEAWIRSRIIESGPVTVAQFMEWGLYHPELGYYTKGPQIGPRGDFTTSPEASPVFGQMLARHVADVEALLGYPERFSILECGPGGGGLAKSLLDSLQVESPALYARCHYVLLEISPALQQLQKETLSHHYPGKAHWVSDLAELEQNIEGAVIGNEFLDAFPVHVLRCFEGEILEACVGVGSEGELIFQYVKLSHQELAHFIERYGIRLDEGDSIEVCLAAAQWMRGLGARVSRGVAVWIDYGDTQPGRYSEARRSGTLLGYGGGSVTDKVLLRPGEQDLTALVDFTHMSNAAQSAGFSELGITRQAHFLLGLGLGTGDASPLAQSDVPQALLYRKGLQTLISMEGLGRFHVLLVSKGLDPAAARSGLAGLRYSSEL